jgi:drug/metabolite transporter (DMT)-like permease
MLILASAIIWSTGGVLIKLLDWASASIIGIRALIAGITLLCYVRASDPCSASEFLRRFANKYTFLSGASIAFTSICFVSATKLTTAANAIVLQYTSPIYVAIINFLLFKQKPRKLDYIVGAAIFCGIAFFFWTELSVSGMLGNILALAAGLSFSFVFFINKLPGARPAYGMIFGQLATLIATLPFIGAQSLSGGISWLYIALLGIFQIGAGYALFSEGIKTCNPLQASLISMAEPLLNPVWVALLTSETPSLAAAAGAALVIGAIAFYILHPATPARELK